MLKKLVEVERCQRVTIDSYLVEGELLLEIYCTLTSERVYPAQHHHRHPVHEVVGYSTSAHRPFGKESEQLASFLMKGTAAESAGSVGPVRALYSFETGEHRRLYTIVWSNPAKLVGRSLTYTVTIEDVVDSSASVKTADVQTTVEVTPVAQVDEAHAQADSTPLTSTTSESDCPDPVGGEQQQQEQVKDVAVQIEEELNVA
jgi:hypothetical protein